MDRGRVGIIWCTHELVGEWVVGCVQQHHSPTSICLLILSEPTALPFWGQIKTFIILTSSNLSQKRDCGSKRVEPCASAQKQQHFLVRPCCSPTRPIKFSEYGPRPGPAHQIFRGWVAAWPSTSHFQKLTARPGLPIIFFQVSARPGPAYHMAARPMKHGLYMGRPDNYVGRPVD